MLTGSLFGSSFVFVRLRVRDVNRRLSQWLYLIGVVAGGGWQVEVLGEHLGDPFRRECHAFLCDDLAGGVGDDELFAAVGDDHGLAAPAHGAAAAARGGVLLLEAEAARAAVEHVAVVERGVHGVAQLDAARGEAHGRGRVEPVHARLPVGQRDERVQHGHAVGVHADVAVLVRSHARPRPLAKLEARAQLAVALHRDQRVEVGHGVQGVRWPGYCARCCAVRGN